MFVDKARPEKTTLLIGGLASGLRKEVEVQREEWVHLRKAFLFQFVFFGACWGLFVVLFVFSFGLCGSRCRVAEVYCIGVCFKTQTLRPSERLVWLDSWFGL